ncbi:MAG: 16S rRNA (cytosine(1402)-N(4))-methyltransferase RsmH [bacterium]|nr:16S rRNA (cytosine(1402)-N(4))-methyltransferase RsmH [bacterium]
MTANEPDGYHQPVLADVVVSLLITDREGAYLDLTAGGGGHLKRLAGALGAHARLYGIDRDPEAIRRATDELSHFKQSHQIIQASFGDLAEVAKQFSDSAFAGILLDLGVSSRQIDDPGRGFSFRQEGPLDMRMDPSSETTAAELIQQSSERQLTEMLRSYGEEKQAARVARAIVKERQREMIRTTTQLASVVSSVIHPPHQVKSIARVFQALRIAVNGELEQLEAVLPAAYSLLAPGGRMAVISYHSLEDRLVKRFLQQKANPPCVCPPRLPICQCDRTPTMKLITRKPIEPDEAEIASNSRARSAKLRVGERL